MNIFFQCIDVILIAALAYIGYALYAERTKRGQWEAVTHGKGGIWYVRWSKMDQHGLYLYVRQYAGIGELLNRHMAERECIILNKQRYLPEAWAGFVRNPFTDKR